MAGPNLELFRFGMYVFFPILIMAHYGDPEWYNRHIYPLRDAYLQPEKADVKLSETETELKSQLAELKEQRLAKRERRRAGSRNDSNTESRKEEEERLV
ncbi:MAG: hypothetical protein CYPHOPRED_004851 [Cyphobasidiales sp. Tagirdzhanova-0007]|nr:MAG: hypothetical protein CYPHOPRED_004851 [Cyphobasidiales sp. Tagirdzhanova-0007]